MAEQKAKKAEKDYETCAAAQHVAQVRGAESDTFTSLVLPLLRRIMVEDRGQMVEQINMIARTKAVLIGFVLVASLK